LITVPLRLLPRKRRRSRRRRMLAPTLASSGDKFARAQACNRSCAANEETSADASNCFPGAGTALAASLEATAITGGSSTCST
jgi:hypothetical protein